MKIDSILSLNKPQPSSAHLPNGFGFSVVVDISIIVGVVCAIVNGIVILLQMYCLYLYGRLLLCHLEWYVYVPYAIITVQKYRFRGIGSRIYSLRYVTCFV